MGAQSPPESALPDYAPTVRYRLGPSEEVQAPIRQVLTSTGEPLRRAVGPRVRARRGVMLWRVDQSFTMRGYVHWDDLERFLRAVERPATVTWLSELTLTGWGRDRTFVRIHRLTISTLSPEPFGEWHGEQPPAPGKEALESHVPQMTAVAVLEKLRAIVGSVSARVEIEMFELRHGGAGQAKVRAPVAAIERVVGVLEQQPCFGDVVRTDLGPVIASPSDDRVRVVLRFRATCAAATERRPAYGAASDASWR